MRIRLLSIVALASFCAGAAPAATFAVNSTSDAVDATPGDGVCDTAGAGVVCTLSAAVMEANANTDEDTIELGAATYSLTLAGIEEDAAAGDLDVNSTVRIEGVGMGATVIDQTTADRVFETGLIVGVLELVDLTVSGGDVVGAASDFGGGLRNLTNLHLERVRVTGNRAFVGGGVANFKTMTATDVRIDGNEATSRGAAIASASFSASGAPPITLQLSNSTIGPNTSAIAPTEMELANANGVTLRNVTVSPDPENLFLASVTIGNQDAELSHVTLLGGLSLYSFDASDTVTFINSAIDYCIPSSPTQTPILVRNGVNASSDAGCGFAAAGGIEGALGLGPLAYNGGPTPTHLPGETSPLLNAAAPGFCASFDQRGLSRPRGPGCDIGAVEVPEASATLAAAIAAGALVALARRKERA